LRKTPLIVVIDTPWFRSLLRFSGGFVVDMFFRWRAQSAIYFFVAFVCPLSSPVLGESDSNREVYFESQVRPLLAKHCFECHGPKKQQGGLRAYYVSNSAAFASLPVLSN
jgi:hypothetical protein